MPLTSPNDVKTLMGWNQVVYIDYNSEGYKPLRVTEFMLGTNQAGDAADYVTGRQDRTAWTKGPIEVQGNITYPLTFESGVVFSGDKMFRLGAQLAEDIQINFGMESTIGERIAGCKVQTATISCNAKEPVQCSATVWGITEQTNLSSGGATEEPEIFKYTDTTYGDTSSGQDVRGLLQIVQVPMWDMVMVEGAPEGMLVIGFKVEIDNQLQRNYTMGNETMASPWGLNATSITAGQRKITGTLTWQSDSDGHLSFIMGTGIGKLTIKIGDVMTMTMNNVLWNANPPRLATGDRVTVESSFTALGTGADDFDALVFTV